MKKVDKKKRNVKKKKIDQTSKKRKTKKNISPQKTRTVKTSTQKNNISKTLTKENKISKITDQVEQEQSKDSLTKSITIPKINNNVEHTKTIPIPKLRPKKTDNKLSLTKSIAIPKLKLKDSMLSLTKSITIPKLKLKKDNSLTKSITIPKIKENDIENNNVIELDLLDDKYYLVAENLYKNQKYDEAYNIYLKLLNKYKKDKRLYKRLICTLTKDYTYKTNSKEFKRDFDDYVTTYKLLANKKEIKSLEYNLENFKNIKAIKRKSKFLLIAFLGFFGIHKFIEKKIFTGIIYLFTLGLFGIGVLADLVNDYAEYEDTLQLDILRYLISFGILTLGILNRNLEHYYLIIIASLIFLPIIYSFILKYIPGFIKVIAMIVLIYFGFQHEQIVVYVPNTIIGNWTTTNESTNYQELKIELENTTLKFNDREEETGINEYDSQNKVLRVKINDTKVYKFIIDIENSKICSYSESRECIIEFNKT